MNITGAHLFGAVDQFGNDGGRGVVRLHSSLLRPLTRGNGMPKLSGGWIEVLAQLRSGEFIFPTADRDGGNAIAYEIGKCAAFAHETIDADEQGERFDWNSGNGSEGGGEGDKSCSGYATGTFGGNHRHE